MRSPTSYVSALERLSTHLVWAVAHLENRPSPSCPPVRARGMHETARPGGGV